MELYWKNQMSESFVYYIFRCLIIHVKLFDFLVEIEMCGISYEAIIIV